MVRDMLKTAAMFRNLEYADAVLGLGSLPRSGGGPLFLQTSPCGLGSVKPIQYEDLERAEDRAEAFKIVAEKHWGLNLNYDPAKLPLVEDLLLATLEVGVE
jgi:hypothetical protein